MNSVNVDMILVSSPTGGDLYKFTVVKTCPLVEELWRIVHCTRVYWVSGTDQAEVAEDCRTSWSGGGTSFNRRREAVELFIRRTGSYRPEVCLTKQRWQKTVEHPGLMWGTSFNRRREAAELFIRRPVLYITTAPDTPV